MSTSPTVSAPASDEQEVGAPTHLDRIVGIGGSLIGRPAPRDTAMHRDIHQQRDLARIGFPRRAGCDFTHRPSTCFTSSTSPSPIARVLGPSRCTPSRGSGMATVDASKKPVP